MLSNVLATLVASGDALLPISKSEFHLKVSGLWRRWRRSSDPETPRKIALAVSGGADSMALAYLCKQLASEEFFPNMKILPFIVDHQARPGSKDEAITVADSLAKIGLDARILTLQWPQATSPTKLTNFESQARRLRYHALGTACRKEHIRALFLGHHEDDNIETALLRVSQGHRGLGLRGMPDVAHIPECEGIYGVSESGTLSLEAFEASKHYVQHRRHFNKRMGVSHFFLPVADGGVYLFRPFLEYPKARLLKTCEENNVPYVNDQTNFDFTLTPRNAVRHLLSTDQLPQALRGPSILNLVKKSRQKGDRIEELSRKCLSTFHILQHDACAGTMTVEFPDLSYPGATPADLQTHLYENEYAQALGLRNLIDVLAPTPRCAASLDKLAQATKATLRPLRDEDSGYFLPHSPFTVGGIMFQTAHPNKSARNTWFLMRQPFKHPEKYINDFAVDIPADTRNSPTQWTHWQLWDSRYWVRVRAVQVRFEEDLRYSRVVQCEGKTLNLRLRPVDEEDIAAMRVILDSTSPGDDVRGPHTHEELLTYKVLWKLLKHQAPGKVRYTLPVLTHDGEERTPVGLPSFRKDMPTIFSVVDEEGKKTHWKVRSEVQYKHVEPEFYQLSGFRKLT